MTGRLTRMKSFFKRPKDSAPIAPPPLPPITDMYAIPAIPTQRQVAKTPQKAPEPVQRITAEQIRELRDLIRYRYGLDIEIWRQRGVKDYKRDKLRENMRRSDAALELIRKTLLEWDRREFFASDTEHQKFVEIKNRLLRGVKANWTQHPPWEFVHHGGNPYQGPWEKYGQPVNGTQQTNGAQRAMGSSYGPAVTPQRPVSGATARSTRTGGEPQSQTGRSQSSINNSPRHVSGAQRSMHQERRPAASNRQPKHRVASPVDSVRTASFRAQTPFDGNGTPIVGSPAPDTRSLSSTWDAQRRVTGPQWQHEPVEHG